eukprot:4026585-Pleurochrysis_carterae.AAC.1
MIAMNSVAVGRERVLDFQGRELLYAAQCEDGVGVVTCCLSCHSFSLRWAVGIFGVVYVNRLAPRFAIAEFQVRPNVHERD